MPSAGGTLAQECPSNDCRRSIIAPKDAVTDRTIRRKRTVYRHREAVTFRITNDPSILDLDRHETSCRAAQHAKRRFKISDPTAIKLCTMLWLRWLRGASCKDRDDGHYAYDETPIDNHHFFSA